MRADDRDVQDVGPQGVGALARDFQERSLAVAAQRRVCDRIDVVGEAAPVLALPPAGIGAGLAAFTSTWGSAVSALAHELALLGVELDRSVQRVVDDDVTGAR